MVRSLGADGSGDAVRPRSGEDQRRKRSSARTVSKDALRRFARRLRQHLKRQFVKRQQECMAVLTKNKGKRQEKRRIREDTNSTKMHEREFSGSEERTGRGVRALVREKVAEKSRCCWWRGMLEMAGKILKAQKMRVQEAVRIERYSPYRVETRPRTATRRRRQLELDVAQQCGGSRRT